MKPEAAASPVLRPSSAAPGGILVTQRVWDSPSEPAVNRDFRTSAYQAIDD